VKYVDCESAALDPQIMNIKA